MDAFEEEVDVADAKEEGSELLEELEEGDPVLDETCEVTKGDDDDRVEMELLAPLAEVESAPPAAEVVVSNTPPDPAVETAPLTAGVAVEIAPPATEVMLDAALPPLLPDPLPWISNSGE